MAQHASKHARLQAVTANRLRDGGVVYFTSAGVWSENLTDAVVAGGDDAPRLLADAEPAVERRDVVGPYLFEVIMDQDAPQPVSVREQIRLTGPTVGQVAGQRQTLGQTLEQALNGKQEAATARDQHVSV